MKRLVIIGGGFAGIAIAQAFSSRFSVTLIDSKPFFEFTPGILRTLVEPEHMHSIQATYTSFLQNISFVQGCVTGITSTAVKLGKRSIPFDYCVIATGSRYKAPIKEQNVVLASRAHHLHAFHDKLVRAKSVVVAGGGLAGVELAAEIATHFPEIQLSLVHPHDRVLSTHTSPSSRYAEHFLRKHKVTFLFNERLDSVSGARATLRSGRVIPADVVCYCTGIVPNTEFVPASWKTKTGHIITNAHLQVPKHPHIFVAGDANSIAEEKTAQHAERQAQIVLRNLRALDEGKLLRSYHQTSSPVIISLGKYDGILEYKKVVITGWIPALLKWAVERKEMRKLR